MVNEKRGKLLIYILVFVILLIAIISIVFPEWFKKITGFASTTRETNVSITVSGTNTVIITVWNETLTGASVTPTEDSIVSIQFNVTVEDPDGVSDINDSSVIAEFLNETETRSNSTGCIDLAEDTTTTANYSCSIEMWYFDVSGRWIINVTANDLGSYEYKSNDTSVFAYSQLQAIVLSPNSLTWPSVSPGTTNQTSNNDPVLINNTGNYNVTLNNVQVQGINLYGADGQFIGVGNVTTDIDTGDSCSGATCVECDGSVLSNGTDQGITNAYLSRGNNSINDGVSGQENLYVCLYQVPSTISSQTYSTTNDGSSAWIVKIV